ncbi:MAG TPA: 5-formyltetrahydrofolate cyclo-ligase [Candidatus Dojkabacteria bacterium]|nr:5-formyltetrahydrofolate cyclo-ligase [Candidatus Dojkabacteria bacterium]
MESQEKKQLRSYFLEFRKLIAHKKTRSQKIIKQLTVLPEFKNAAHILLYDGTENEVSTEGLIKRCIARKKHVYLPVLKNIGIAEVTDINTLRPNKLKILEPVVKSAGLKSASFVKSFDLIDLAIVPGLAFDRMGFRLGHGSGFYDKLLEKLPEKTRLIGLAFQEQIVNVLPQEPHDHKMDMILTDEGIIALVKAKPNG